MEDKVASLAQKLDKELACVFMKDMKLRHLVCKTVTLEIWLPASA